MEIREARVEEYDAVGELTHGAYVPLFGGADLGRYGDDLRDTAGRAARGEIIVAERDGTLVGALTYLDDYNVELGGLDVELENSAGFRVLAVSPEVQGAGVGERLVRWCLERAASDGRAAVVLHTTDYMQAAQRLYARLGFVRFEELDYQIGRRNPVPVMGFRRPLDLA